MVHGRLPQSLSGHMGGLPPARDDGLRVDLLSDEELSLLSREAVVKKQRKTSGDGGNIRTYPQQLGSQHSD